MGVYKNNNGTLQPIAGRGGALIDDTLTTTSNTWSATKMNNTFVTDANYTHTDNNYTNAEKSKLDSVATGAEVNVQSDWEVTDNTSDAYIKNKPTVPEDIEDLNNVTITSPTSGQVLKYNGTDWVNGSGGADVTTREFILSVEQWNNGVYDLSTTYPDNEYNIQISPCSNTTEAQLQAYSDAQMMGSSEHNAIYALGTVPTIAINVMLTITRKGV